MLSFRRSWWQEIAKHAMTEYISRVMRLTGSPIKYSRLAACVFAVMAMCVSAVAACACSHHQPKVAADPPSCHSSSHAEVPETETGELELSDNFNAGCNCFAVSPGPAVFSKSETKKAVPEKAAEAESAKIELRRTERLISASTPKVEKPFFFDPGLFLASGPSRAPPRL